MHITIYVAKTKKLLISCVVRICFYIYANITFLTCVQIKARLVHRKKRNTTIASLKVIYRQFTTKTVHRNFTDYFADWILYKSIENVLSLLEVSNDQGTCVGLYLSFVGPVNISETALPINWRVGGTKVCGTWVT